MYFLCFVNSFATSCDALKDGATEDYCICKDNYVGGRCENCGPGYYGQPETMGKILKSDIFRAKRGPARPKASKLNEIVKSHRAESVAVRELKFM